MHKKRAMKRDMDSIVYKISCSKCGKSYYGKTGSGLGTIIREPKMTYGTIGRLRPSFIMQMKPGTCPSGTMSSPYTPV